MKNKMVFLLLKSKLFQVEICDYRGKDGSYRVLNGTAKIKSQFKSDLNATGTLCKAKNPGKKQNHRSYDGRISSIFRS
jgi:hypothetical protein